MGLWRTLLLRAAAGVLPDLGRKLVSQADPNIAPAVRAHSGRAFFEKEYRSPKTHRFITPAASRADYCYRVVAGRKNP